MAFARLGEVDDGTVGGIGYGRWVGWTGYGFVAMLGLLGLGVENWVYGFLGGFFLSHDAEGIMIMS